RPLAASIAHADTLVTGRDHTAPLPTRTRVRADTRRLSWLNEEDVEEEVFRNGRNQRRDGCAPFLRGEHRHRAREHRGGHQGDHTGGRERRARRGRFSSLSRRGAATVRLRLADAVL